MLRNLQKTILGKKDETLSLEELICLSSSPEKNLSLVKALNLEKINDENLLLASISNAKEKEDLIPIAFALRYGANPNIYVVTPKIGSIHLLAFIYHTLGTSDFSFSSSSFNKSCNNPLLNSIVLLSKVSGANPLLPVFDKNKEKKELSLFDKVKEKDVNTWLCESGYDSILSCLDNCFTNVKPETLTMIGILLDNLSLIKTEPKLEDILKSHSYNVLQEYIDKVNLDRKDLLQICMKYLNLTAFEIFIDQGIKLSYLEIIILLLKMKKYKFEKDLISLSQIFNMLLYAVERGAIIDEYHFKFLEMIDPQLALILKKSYEVPKYIKSCRVKKGEVSIEMKKIVYQLGLDPTLPKDALCSQILKISEANLEDVKKSIITRQKKRISSTLSDYIDFINNVEPEILIRNRSLINDVYGYPDNDICFYRDQDNVSWIFVRNNFSELVERKKNPYTDLPLPQLLIDEMEKRNEYVNSIFGKREMNPIPISEVLDSLNKPDKITNEYTNEEIKLFYNLASKYNINEEYISSLDLKNYIKELEELPKDFALAAFAVISLSEINFNDKQTDFFANLK